MMESSLFGSASLSKDFTPMFSDAASFFLQQQQQQQQLPQYSQSLSDTDVLITCTKKHTMKRSNGKLPCYSRSQSIICDLCDRSKVNKDSFFYHCSICQYDICMNCFGSIKALQQQSTQSSTNNDAVINEIKDFYQLHNPDKLKDIDALLLKYTPTDLLQRIKEKYKKCAQPDLQPLVAGSPLSPSPNDSSGTQFSSSGPSFKSSNSNSTNNSQTSGVWSSSAIGWGNQWSNKPSQTSGVWSSSAIGWGNQWSNKPSQVTFGQSTHATGFNISSSNPFSGTAVADAFVLPAKASQPNFKPKKIHEGGRTLNIQSICADDEYLQLSPEELQLTQSVGSPSDNTTQSATSSSVAANTIASADTRSQATSLLPSASEAWIKVEPNNPNPVQFSIGGGTTISGKVSAIWIKCSR